MRKHAWWILLPLAMLFLVYLPGLNGGLLLDDAANLAPLGRWMAGDISLAQLVLSNGSGPLGRPLSMLSFAASGALFGPGADAVKLGNLILHALNAVLVFSLLVQVDTVLRSRVGAGLAGGQLAAVALTALWALHPLQVSSVLYAVQRMAILANTCILLTLVFYLAARLRVMRVGRLDVLAWTGFVASGVACFLGVMAKENAVLAIPASFLVEYLCFQSARFDRVVPFRITLALGCAAAIALLFAVLSGSDFGGVLDYRNRPFSVSERLFTQGRVLFDYVGQILWPRVDSMGLYKDSYLPSAGALSPVSTVVALIAWAAIIMIAVRVRWRQRLISLGILLFLCLHLMESTVLPLLLYFEHRNYLALLGVLLAAWSIGAWILSWIPRLQNRLRGKPLIVLVSAALLLFVYQTGGRVIDWGDRNRLWVSELKSHPESRWLRMELAAEAMESFPPDIDSARAHYETLAASGRHDTARIGKLYLASLGCIQRWPFPQLLIDSAMEGAFEPFEADVLKATEHAVEVALVERCDGLDLLGFADGLSKLADRSRLGNSHPHVWRVRFSAARLAHAAGQNAFAIDQLEKGWGDGVADPPLGVMLTELLILSGRFEEAARRLNQTRQRLGPEDTTGNRRIAELARLLTDGANSP